jgi:uncharacterized RDD family membrane protein YckC
MFEFRCTRCWQPLLADCEEAETMTQCKWCHQETVIPEATPERIERAMVNQTDEAQEEMASPGLDFDDDPTRWTQAAIEAELKREMGFDPSDREMLRAYAASPYKRLAAHIVDSLLITCVNLVGVVVFIFLAATGIIDTDSFESSRGEPQIVPLLNALLVLVFPTIVLMMFQWKMISVEGQTLGKMLLGIRIVRGDGSSPGFLQGVVLRNWLRVLLSFVPFFAMVDLAFIFSDSRRCLHDHMSGTQVIDT